MWAGKAVDGNLAECLLNIVNYERYWNEGQVAFGYGLAWTPFVQAANDKWRHQAASRFPESPLVREVWCPLAFLVAIKLI